MREAIGGTWIMQLVIIFMLVFVGFLALALNYSKAFQMKNDILTMIEKKEGVNSESLKLINNYLASNRYSLTKSCPKGSYGVSDLTRNAISQVQNNTQKYYYCLQKVSSETKNSPKKAYYKVELFFKFNLPIIGDIFTFSVPGATNDIIVPKDIINMQLIRE